MAVNTPEHITVTGASVVASRIGHDTAAEEVITAYRDHADLIRRYLATGTTQESAVLSVVVNANLKRE
jgi:hypothetical protein